MCVCVCVSQEIEKREHEEKQAAKADERRKKQEPGFDGRWYTDTDAHLKHSTRYSSSIHCIIFIILYMAIACEVKKLCKTKTAV